MKPDQKYQTSLMTLETVINLATALSCAASNPDHDNRVRSIATEHKVASSVNKQLSKHLAVE